MSLIDDARSVSGIVIPYMEGESIVELNEPQLAALKELWLKESATFTDADKAIAYLKDKVAQEPIVYMFNDATGNTYSAVVDSESYDHYKKLGYKQTPLYTAAPNIAEIQEKRLKEEAKKEFSKHYETYDDAAKLRKGETL